MHHSPRRLHFQQDNVRFENNTLQAHFHRVRQQKRTTHSKKATSLDDCPARYVHQKHGRTPFGSSVLLVNVERSSFEVKAVGTLRCGVEDALFE
jgi:hypothetical protein